MSITFYSPSGFDWINFALALVAVAGFIVSLYFSRKSLKQAKKLVESQNNAQLFSQKCDILEFFYKLVDEEEWMKRLTSYDITLKLNRLESAFDNTTEFSELVSGIRKHIQEDAPLPIDANKLSEEHNEDFVILLKYLNMLDILSKQLELYPENNK